MSAALKGLPSIYRLSLWLARTPRRPPRRPSHPSLVQFLHSTHRLQSAVIETTNDGPAIAHQSNLLKITPSDIITLNEHLDSNNVVSAYNHFVMLTSRLLDNNVDSPPQDSLGSYIPPDTVIQPVLEKLLEAIMYDDERDPNLPKALAFLEEMGKIGVLRTTYYAKLLMWMVKNGANTGSILPVLDSALSFNSETIKEVVSEVDEFIALDFDVATPHFITFLILQHKGIGSEQITRLELVLRYAQYPSYRHVERVLDHYNFSIDLTTYILFLLRDFNDKIIYTNMHTLRQKINANLASSPTPEALMAYYTTLKADAPKGLASLFYSTFISVFLGLPASSKAPLDSQTTARTAAQTAAFSVWNDMVKDGITPTVIEWTNLMKSFAKAQDKSALIPLWDLMLGNGVMPDEKAWTVRIHALLEANMVKEGLEALREMQRTGVSPTSGTINAVLDGLLRHAHYPEAESVIAVAGRLGIKKDIGTYNTLLNSLMKQQRRNPKKFNEALTLIREMATNGITPDIRTVTLILDGMYKYSKIKPSLSAVLSLLEYSESAGIKVNTWTFTCLIRALLEEGREDAAIDMLLIMESRNMTGNAATYTILLTHYFLKGDLQSINDLLREIVQKRVVPDSRMWRELTLGFAELGQVKMLKDTLARMYEGSTRMGILGFMSVLKRLGQKELLLEAKEVVEGMLDQAVVGRVVRENTQFWDVVAELGKGTVLAELTRNGKVFRAEM